MILDGPLDRQRRIEGGGKALKGILVTVVLAEVHYLELTGVPVLQPLLGSL